MARTKDSIANDLYGYDFDELMPGQKARVTRTYNAENNGTPLPSRSGIACEVGRIGVNGTKRCIMTPGSTVKDLLEQANYQLKPRKESVQAHSTGNAVSLSSAVVNGEIYMITTEIKSGQ